MNPNDPVPPETSPTGDPDSGDPDSGFPKSVFLYKLTVATLCAVLFALAIVALVYFRTILQPLLVAVFIGYLILPLHDRLEKRGLPSALAYIVILLLIIGGLFGLGTLIYHSTSQVLADLPEYQQSIRVAAKNVLVSFMEEKKADAVLESTMPTVTEFGTLLAEALGSFLNFFSYLVVTFIYLIFLVAEKLSFSQRMREAFGSDQGERVLTVVGSINEAISQYIAVKTFISFLAGILSLLVLWVMKVDGAVTWALLIFLFNYIPYLGSLVATALPIVMTLAGQGLWPGLVVAILLIAIQQVLGIVVEPRMAGHKLGVSPLLILLSLAFWGVIWGIVGMILAVPLLVVLKIILENIRETWPVAKLMSNM